MDDLEISKMKVADLKKQLKSRGLPVTGNKTELIERLQKSLSDGGDINSGVGEEEEFDEEEILGGDDDVDDDDSNKITPQEEAEVLGGNIRIKEDSLLMPSEKKKITLKRSEPFLSSSITETTEAASESIPAPQAEDSLENKENSEEDDQPKKKIIKISTDDLETDSKTNGVKKLDSQLSEEEKRLARIARFGAVDSKPAKLSMNVGSTDVDKLKKRAERFGEITSKTLKKVESLEKKKERLERFGTTAAAEEEKKEKTNSGSEDGAKEARAARFGVQENKEGEDDLKKKRAERFGAK